MIILNQKTAESLKLFGGSFVKRLRQNSERDIFYLLFR